MPLPFTCDSVKPILGWIFLVSVLVTEYNNHPHAHIYAQYNMTRKQSFKCSRSSMGHVVLYDLNSGTYQNCSEKFTILVIPVYQDCFFWQF